jgi:hypothetical protein
MGITAEEIIARREARRAKRLAEEAEAKLRQVEEDKKAKAEEAEEDRLAREAQLKRLAERAARRQRAFDPPPRPEPELAYSAPRYSQFVRVREDLLQQFYENTGAIYNGFPRKPKRERTDPELSRDGYYGYTGDDE